MRRSVIDFSFKSLPVTIVMLMWGLQIAFPFQQLQNHRLTLLGYVIPIYYFFLVGPILIAGALFFFSKDQWSQIELVWWLFPLICVPGIVMSDDRLWSSRQWLSWVIRGVIPGGIIMGASDKSKVRSFIVWWIYPIVIIAALIGLSEVFQYRNILWRGVNDKIEATEQPANPFYRPRAVMALSSTQQGTIGNRIPYSAVIASFFPLSLWILQRRRRYRWMDIIASASIVLVMIVSYVRAIWITSMLGIILITAAGLLPRSKETRNLGIFLAICIAVLLSWPRTAGLILSRIHSFSLHEASIHERIDVLQTVRVLKVRPLFGVGFGQFPTAARPYYHGSSIWIETPDDQYLRWAIENGLIGFIGLIFTLTVIPLSAWRCIKGMNDLETSYFKAIVLGWLCLAFSFLFFDGYYWGACNITFCCLLGAIGRYTMRNGVEAR